MLFALSALARNFQFFVYSWSTYQLVFLLNIWLQFSALFPSDKLTRSLIQEWEKALVLLSQMENKALQLDIISFDAGISACEKASEWEQALVLLDLSTQKALQPNVITCSALISACGNAGEWPCALHFFEEACLGVGSWWQMILGVAQEGGPNKLTSDCWPDCSKAFLESSTTLALRTSKIWQIWIYFYAHNILQRCLEREYLGANCIRGSNYRSKGCSWSRIWSPTMQPSALAKAGEHGSSLTSLPYHFMGSRLCWQPIMISDGPIQRSLVIRVFAVLAKWRCVIFEN